MHDKVHPKTGLIVFAHGSTVEQANEGVRTVTAAVAKGTSFDYVDTAFLDCAQPDLAASVASLSSFGVTHIVVVPFFLTLGIHLQRDLPGIVTGLKDIHPGVTIHVTAPLEGHPALTGVVIERAAEALKESGVAGQTS